MTTTPTTHPRSRRVASSPATSCLPPSRQCACVASHRLARSVPYLSRTRHPFHLHDPPPLRPLPPSHSELSELELICPSCRIPPACNHRSGELQSPLSCPLTPPRCPLSRAHFLSLSLPLEPSLVVCCLTLPPSSPRRSNQSSKLLFFWLMSRHGPTLKDPSPSIVFFFLLRSTMHHHLPRLQPKTTSTTAVFHLVSSPTIPLVWSTRAYSYSSSATHSCSCSLQRRHRVTQPHRLGSPLSAHLGYSLPPSRAPMSPPHLSRVPTHPLFSLASLRRCRPISSPSPATRCVINI